MALKIVDKYEFLEGEGKTEDGVDIIPARHTVLKEQYTLKKLSLKEDDKGKYGNLVNQLLVLKEVNDDWAIKCHKMLKTSNNLYLVYDKMGECTLADLLESNKQSLTFETKESIANQLIMILSELKLKGIVNLNITLQTIQIINAKLPGRNSKPTVRLNNFEYSILMRQALDIKIFKNLPVSQFKPPQLCQKPPVVGYHCDMYSVGKVLQCLDISLAARQSKDRSTYDKIEHLKEIISHMTVQDYRNRITLEETKPFFQMEQKQSPHKHLQIQRSKTLTSNFKPKETEQHQQQSDQFSKRLSRKMTNTLTTQSKDSHQEKQSPNNRTYCLQILKRRNLSIFLLRCCQYCAQSDLADINTVLMTSFLLLKKSTQVIAHLSKFLMTGHDAHIKIPQKQLASFFKTHDYFKLQSQVAKQLSLSKKHLNLMVKKIGATYSSLLQLKIFADETNQEKTNEQFFKQTIIHFLTQNVKNHRIQRENKKILNYFLLMSYIIDFGSYQKMFEELISQQMIQLDGQTLIIKIDQMSSIQIVAKLRATCSSLHTEK